MAALRVGVGAVDAPGENQGDIFRLHTGGIEFLQHGGHYFPGGHGAGDVRGDENDFLSRMDHFPQRRRADGGCQRCTDKILLASGGRRKGARLQNGQKTLFRYSDSLCACIVSKLDVHSFSPQLRRRAAVRCAAVLQRH